MKKLLKLLFFIMTITISAHASDINDDNHLIKKPVQEMTSAEKIVRKQEIELRLTEIKAIDKSELNQSEKVQLRLEKRNLKKEEKEINNSNSSDTTNFWLMYGIIIAGIIGLVILVSR